MNKKQSGNKFCTGLFFYVCSYMYKHTLIKKWRDRMQKLLEMLPPFVSKAIQNKGLDLSILEEIRMRAGQPIELIYKNHSILTEEICSFTLLQSVLSVMSQHSVYRLEEELKQGYMTICGGHRIGLAGKVLIENGAVKRIRDISSINIRIAREKIGCAVQLQAYLYQNGWKNTVFIGPPACGKTTLLRDLTRIISTGVPEQKIFPMKVGLVDERSEIAGCVSGVPQYRLGPRVDVLDACPKAEGIMMLIRSMSPHVIVVDELGGTADAQAVRHAVYAGVKLMVSAHGYTYTDFLSRPFIKELTELGAFERFIELSSRKGPGTIEQIFNQTGQKIR